MILWVLQEVINKQLDSRSFRCGCKCLACCDWVPATLGGNASSAGDASVNGSTPVSYQCYEATDDKPCSPYAKCQARGGPGGAARAGLLDQRLISALAWCRQG